MGFSVNHSGAEGIFHGGMRARKTAISASTMNKIQTHLVLSAVSNNLLKLFN